MNIQEHIPLPEEAYSSTELNKCSGKYYFITVLEINSTCLCVNIQGGDLWKMVSIIHVIFSLIGIIAILFGLFVAGNISTRSSNAISISLLSIYNIIRLISIFILAVYTLNNHRESASKVS